MADCTFCTKFGAHGNPKEWFDKELRSFADFVVVAGVGALVPGYLLVISRAHFPSAAMLPQPSWDALPRLRREVIKACRKVFGIQPVIFEHGSSDVRHLAGGCINHMHLHILPIKFGIKEELSHYYDMLELNNIEDIRRLRNKKASYLYLQNQDGAQYLAEVTDVPSQLIRRIVAKKLGRPYEWDYAGFPEYRFVAETINRFSPWPMLQGET